MLNMFFSNPTPDKKFINSHYLFEKYKKHNFCPNLLYEEYPSRVPFDETIDSVMDREQVKNGLDVGNGILMALVSKDRDHVLWLLNHGKNWTFDDSDGLYKDSGFNLPNDIYLIYRLFKAGFNFGKEMWLDKLSRDFIIICRTHLKDPEIQRIIKDNHEEFHKNHNNYYYLLCLKLMKIKDKFQEQLRITGIQTAMENKNKSMEDQLRIIRDANMKIENLRFEIVGLLKE